MSDPLDSDRPWTEEQWLAEFRESEARSARFGELLETLADHPDRDALISREMGWDDDEEVDSDDSELDDSLEVDFGPESDDQEEPPCADDDAPLDLLHKDDERDEADGEPRLSDEPAYRGAVELAEFAIKFNRRVGTPSLTDVHQEEMFGELLGNVLIPAAKIRGGHRYGYDTNICGNIVCNRFALEATEKAERALCELDRVGVLAAEWRKEMLPRLRPLISHLNERIAEMRKRVWW
jgi:hypothetical protein